MLPSARQRQKAAPSPPGKEASSSKRSTPYAPAGFETAPTAENALRPTLTAKPSARSASAVATAAAYSSASVYAHCASPKASHNSAASAPSLRIRDLRTCQIR